MFKKYQCRYFDSRGRPLKSPCSQGDSCRFVHPEDPNWPGLKPTDKRINFASPTSRRASANLTGKTRFSPKRKASSPDDRPERRSAPLVSQNDLFQKCKIEADEAVRENYGQSRRRNDDEQGQNRSRGRGSKSSRERRSRNPSASSQKPYETRTYHAIEQDRSLADHTSKLGSYRSRTISANKNRELNVSSIDAENQYSRISRSSSPSLGGRVDGKNVSPSSESNSSLVFVNGPAPQEFDRAKERASRVVDLFRDLSRLCHKATQDLEDQAREEKRLKAYTELASTLSKVSASAANLVMPALADILLKQAQCKQRADDNFKSIAKVWEEVFDTFVVEISHEIDVRLEEAMRKNREEADDARGALGYNSLSRGLKRQRSEHFGSWTENNGGKENEASFFARKDEAMQEEKRRRFDV